MSPAMRSPYATKKQKSFPRDEKRTSPRNESSARPLSQKQHSAPHARNLGAVARFMLSSAGHRRPERPGHKKAGTFSGPGPIVARSRTQRYSADGWACMTISSSPSRISISRSPSIRYESIRSSSLINRSSCA